MASDRLLGSCAYVARPTYPVASMLAAIDLEQMSAAGSGLYVIGGGAGANRWLTDLLRNRQREELIPGVIETVAMSSDTDHWCFWDEGLPVLSVAGRTGGDWGYHSPRDTIDGISVESLAANAHLVWLALEPLARSRLWC